ncbi:MAG TPA: 1-(5-phosphoribosyl)-5-[(5-phosphoribosylamino)methylideneamino]imidazole-4-carboxamide isomerase [Solirubrobacteraceae bacterium]|nr:1-(5-phosphoribosyl)-5-[(5-phosphoribosylamino)methylideneamino]imidazole-4-carboxamide isomerase [Solirubrobacteraceae bacterium]
MILYPAIDIMGGNAVRLTQGDFEARKVYDVDPLAAARAWARAGARALHVVDLDGARAGRPVNLEHVRRITGELQAPVQLGGGLRSLRALEQAFAAGARRAILGTAAFSDQNLLDAALERYGPERVLVSVDVRGGKVATAGWTETSAMGAVQAVTELRARGVQELVFTDVDRDGMLGGPDLGVVGEVVRAADGGRVLYSGGIGQLEDLVALADLGEPSLAGVIVGKALYEERFTVEQALAVLGE